MLFNRFFTNLTLRSLIHKIKIVSHGLHNFFFDTHGESVKTAIFENLTIFFLQVTARDGRPILICEEGDTETSRFHLD